MHSIGVSVHTAMQPFASVIMTPHSAFYSKAAIGMLQTCSHTDQSHRSSRMHAILTGRVRARFISISTQTQNIKLCNVGKYNQSKDEKADKQH